MDFQLRLDLTYNLLNKHKAAVVWSEFSSRCSYPVVTADFLYLRINEENSGEKWISKLKEKVSPTMLMVEQGITAIKKKKNSLTQQ
jgi:hypothetical protein